MKRILFFSVAVILFSACANQLAPGGGERDKIPPEVEEYYPETGTVNFSDDHISITFSEYVDERSGKEAVFISPRIFGDIEYDWSGRTLEIEFPDTALKSGFTYVVTVGTDVADINEKNKMAEPFVFTFSTGPIIDKGIVSGKIFDEKPSGVMIFLYKIDTAAINPQTRIPDYLTQAGEKGEYKIMGVAEGKYRVFAIRDEMKDFKYSAETDAYGVAFSDISLDKNDTLVSGINFKLVKEDTTKPDLASAIMTDIHHIIIETSEPVDSLLIKASDFSISDSTDNLLIPVDYFFKGKSKRKQYVLAVKDSLNPDNEYFLNYPSFVDNKGNRGDGGSLHFVASDRPDTNKPMMFDFYTYSDDKKLEFSKGRFEIKFDDGVEFNKIGKNISLNFGQDKSYQLSVDKIDDGTFLVKVLNILPPDADLELKINMSDLPDISGNIIDSTFTVKIKTNNDLDFTGASGIVIGIDSAANVYTILRSDDNKQVYKAHLDSVNSFNFEKVKPAKYLLWAFVDSDSSGDYSYGKPFPFEKSERFTVYPDTLNLRARWPVGDITLQFSK